MDRRKHLGEGLRFAKLPCAMPDCGAEAEAGRLGGIMKGTVSVACRDARPLKNTLSPVVDDGKAKERRAG